jgi:SecDF, P1 head subdomain
MAETAARGTRRRSHLHCLAATVATLGVLTGCGGQSASDQVAAVAVAYNRAFVAADGHTVCALMTSSLRRQLKGPGGPGQPTSCAEVISFAAAARHQDYAPHLIVTAVHIRGARATVMFRGRAGVGTFPLSREAGHWRIAGPVHYTTRNWLQADYRVRDAGGLSASAVASILDSRARTIIGALVQTRTISPDEVRLAVAEPARLSDLAPVTRRDNGHLAFYDWEANVLTPAGTPVGEALRQRDDAAMLISQGSGSEPPGSAGGLTRTSALKLADAQRPAADAGPAQSKLPPGWLVVAGPPPSRAAVDAGADPDARYFVLRDRAALSRSDIRDAYETFDARGQPALGIRFTPRGARAFQGLSAEIARRGAALSTPELALNQHIATVVDGKLVSVIYVDYRVYPHGIPPDEATDISGGFTPLGAYHLANQIAAEPLPADLQLIRETTVSRRVPPGSDLPAGATKARHPTDAPA